MEYRKFAEKAVEEIKAESPSYKNCEMLSWMYTVQKHCPARLDRETAVAWVHGMKNADGTTGPHWTMGETGAILEYRGGGEDPLAFWVSMNAMYSDLGLLFKKYGSDTPGAYADFACAFWLHDKDVVEDKLAAYYAGAARH